MNRIKRTKTSSWGAKFGTAIALAALVVPAASAAPGPFTTVKPVADIPNNLPPVGTVTRQLTRFQAGKDRVAVVSGVLTAPSTATPEWIGESYLRSKPGVIDEVAPSTLKHVRTISFPRGHALRYQQTYQGLDVVGGTTVVRIDEQGHVRWAGSSARPIPSDLSPIPTLSQRNAIDVAARQAGYAEQFSATVDLDNTAKLVVYTQPNMERPRLAYWVQLPADMTRLTSWRAFVDAHNGHLYRMENRVVTGGLPVCDPGSKNAYVYPENPIATPDLECASLAPYLEPGATTLVNEDIATNNCIDNNGCRDVQVLLTVSVHWCDDDPIATTNKTDDFRDHQFTNETDPDDTFAEVQMFYHLNKAFDVARSMGGFTDLNAKPLSAAVNFKLPIDIAAGDIMGLLNHLCTNGTYTGSEPLLPFDNAAFVPAGGLLGYPDTDGLVFGQGNTVDFASDGDVVYHEFGHALMNTVAPDLGFGYFDEYGFDPTPGGMHEGYADLMTLWVTDDPAVGEHAGSGLGLGGPIRDMDNTSACPDELVGETHEDALPITGAIYEARQTIIGNGGDRDTFDRAVFAAQQMFGGSDNYETAAAKTVAEVEMAMGNEHANTLSQVLADRGISDCNNRIADGTQAKRLLFAGSLQMQTMGAFPAPVQFEYDLPGGADSITLNISRVVALAAGLGGSPTVHVGLKQGSPIMWTENGGGATGDFTTSAAVNVDMTTNAGTVTLQGPFAPGTYYLQYYSEGGALALVNSVISHAGDNPPTPDAGVTPDAGAGDGDAGGPGVDGDDSGGCGCSVGKRERNPAGALLFTLLGMVAIVIIRRRR